MKSSSPSRSKRIRNSGASPQASPVAHEHSEVGIARGESTQAADAQQSTSSKRRGRNVDQALGLRHELRAYAGRRRDRSLVPGHGVPHSPVARADPGVDPGDARGATHLRHVAPGHRATRSAQATRASARRSARRSATARSRPSPSRCPTRPRRKGKRGRREFRAWRA